MEILISLAIFFSAVICHEFAHAWVANRLGDPTAKARGRLTLNPLAHIDPFGTIILPMTLILTKAPVLFGWAKPVPINFANLGNPKKDMIWVGFAGPGANLIMAFACSLILKFSAILPDIVNMTLLKFLIVNVVLAVFNLIPIPPLDGSRILMGLAPLQLARQISRIEPYGFIMLFALLYMGLFDKIVWPAASLIMAFLLR
jgi:Zn-dependent protease